MGPSESTPQLLHRHTPVAATTYCTRPVESPYEPWSPPIHGWGGIFHGSLLIPVDPHGGKSKGRVKNPRVGWVKSMGKRTRDCHLTIKCGNCAKSGHPSAGCSTPKTKARCTQCRGPHNSQHRRCPFRTKEVEKLKIARAAIPPYYPIKATLPALTIPILGPTLPPSSIKRGGNLTAGQQRLPPIQQGSQEPLTPRIKGPNTTVP